MIYNENLALLFLYVGLGVNFMEKTVVIRQTEITFSIWDLGGKTIMKTRLDKVKSYLFIGQKEFASMMPLVCGDAVAILFTFDLARKSTLNNLREWYRQARGLNKVYLFLNRKR